MKQNVIAIIALMLLVAAPASAQYHISRRPAPRYGSNYNRPHRPGNPIDLYYGFRLGLGVAQVSSDSKLLDSNDPRTGLTVGAVVGVGLTPSAPLYFETGLMYNEKGGKSTYNGEKFTYQLNYLELPLVLKYRIPVSRGITVDPLFGGYLSCGVGGKIKDYNERAAYGSFSDDYNDNFRRFDGGLRVGCGVSVSNFYAEAAYDLGLANVGKDNFDDTRTGSFNLSVGVNF